MSFSSFSMRKFKENHMECMYSRLKGISRLISAEDGFQSTFVFVNVFKCFQEIDRSVELKVLWTKLSIISNSLSFEFIMNSYGE